MAAFRITGSIAFPCIECAKIIIQSGIRTLIYEDDRRDKDVNSFAASKKLFDAAGITYKKYILETHLKGDTDHMGYYDN